MSDGLVASKQFRIRIRLSPVRYETPVSKLGYLHIHVEENVKPAPVYLNVPVKFGSANGFISIVIFMLCFPSSPLTITKMTLAHVDYIEIIHLN